MPINTGPSNMNPGSMGGGGATYNFYGGQQEQKKKRMGTGMVDPSFRRMMEMKAGQPTADRLRSQGFKTQTPSPGMFPGMSPSIFYQHFDEQGRARQPQQQQQPQQNPMMGGMGMGGFNPMMGMMGGGQGINTGPSDQMMRQFNPGMMGNMGGIWNPVYQGGPDTSGMMGQMRNRGMGGGMMGGLFGRMGY